MEQFFKWELAGETEVLRENQPSTTLSTTDSLWTGLGWNPDCHGEKPGAKWLSHGMLFLLSLHFIPYDGGSVFLQKSVISYHNTKHHIPQGSTHLLIYCRAYGDYIRRGIGLTTGFIGSQCTLYNSLQCIHFITQQLSLFSSSEDFGSSSATMLQPILMASLAITILVTRRNSVPYSELSKQASSSLLLAFASMVILGVELHRDPLAIASTNIACGQTTKKTSTAASVIVAPERTTKKTRLRVPYCSMISSPEQTPKKTPPIVESCRLPRNGCKQTLALLTVDPQRAHYNIILVMFVPWNFKNRKWFMLHACFFFTGLHWYYWLSGISAWSSCNIES
jgi:hypothetical protein